MRTKDKKGLNFGIFLLSHPLCHLSPLSAVFGELNPYLCSVTQFKKKKSKLLGRRARHRFELGPSCLPALTAALLSHRNNSCIKTLFFQCMLNIFSVVLKVLFIHIKLIMKYNNQTAKNKFGII